MNAYREPRPPRLTLADAQPTPWWHLVRRWRHYWRERGARRARRWRAARLARAKDIAAYREARKLSPSVAALLSAHKTIDTTTRTCTRTGWTEAAIWANPLGWLRAQGITEEDLLRPDPEPIKRVRE